MIKIKWNVLLFLGYFLISTIALGNDPRCEDFLTGPDITTGDPQSDKSDLVQSPSLPLLLGKILEHYRGGRTFTEPGAIRQLDQTLSAHLWMGEGQHLTDGVSVSFMIETALRAIQRSLGFCFRFLRNHLPSNEEEWQRYFEENLDISLTEDEFLKLSYLMKLSSDARSKIFQEVSTLILQKSLRSFDVFTQAELWRRKTLHLLLSLSEAKKHGMIKGRVMKWRVKKAGDNGVISTTYLLVEHADGITFTVVCIPKTAVLDEMPTHVRITETGDILPLVRLSYPDRPFIFAADLTLSPQDYRFINLVFLREPQAFSSVFVDLRETKVFLPLTSAWIDVMADPMVTLFREELASPDSPLSRLVQDYFDSIRDPRIKIESLKESELTFLGYGRFRYSLQRYNSEKEAFYADSPKVVLIVDMTKRSKPKILTHSIENLPK